MNSIYAVALMWLAIRWEFLVVMAIASIFSWAAIAVWLLGHYKTWSSIAAFLWMIAGTSAAIIIVVELQLKHGTPQENGSKVLRLAMQSPLVGSELKQ